MGHKDDNNSIYMQIYITFCKRNEMNGVSDHDAAF